MAKTAGRGKYDRTQSAGERQAERREHLLDVATEVFAQRGYAGTRVDDIVAAAGISRRTLYEEFESVESMMTELYDRAVRISFTLIIERLVQVSDPIERIRIGVATYYEMIADNPAASKVVFEEYRSVGPTQLARYELNTTRFALLLLESLNAAFIAGRLGRAPDEITVYALIKGLEAVGTRALRRGEHRQLPQVVPAMATLIVEAFRSATPG